MIYLDNAATSFPKPQSVINTVAECMKHMGANPARGGHKMAINAGEKLYECREIIASFFGLDNPCKLIFTLNATHALNLVIKGILEKGDHVIYTQMEHNSVLRPIYSMGDDIESSMAIADDMGYVTADEVKKHIRDNTKLIVMSHVSNVCGSIQDIASVGKIARDKSIAFLVDASQSAGVIDIDVERDNIDFLVAPGHKALYGPMGTGILCINCDYTLKPLICGGTGSYSMDLSQPSELPDALESGTLNFPGVCGLAKGVDFVKSIGVDNIAKHEMKLAEYLLLGLREIKGVSVLGNPDLSGRTAVVSFTCNERMSTDVATYLSSSYNIACRALYHCAYPSHLALGSYDGGSVRISPGVFNTIGQIKTLLYALEHMS